MSTFSTLCTVANGRLKLFDRESFDRGLTQFCDGEEIEIILESVAQRHSRAQERFFHGPVLKAFEPLGYRKQEAKDMLCLMFIPHEVHRLDGSVVLVPGRTSILKVEEYNDLIEQAIQLAAENGQVVMDGAEWRARRAQDAKRKDAAA